MSNEGKESFKDGGKNESNNELEEMKINKKKHKSIFRKVMSELQKMFEKKYKVVEYCSKMKNKDRLDNNGDTSCALQAKADKHAENIPREKDKDTPVKREFSDDSSSQSDARAVDDSIKMDAEYEENLTEKQAYMEILKSWTKISTSQDTECKDILITGLSSNTTEDDIVMYFQSTRNSGGGDAEIQLFDKNGCRAILSFDDAEDLTRVVSREHSLMNKKILVQKYPSQKFSISLGTLSPRALDEAFIPQLKENLVKEPKAFCYKDETKEALVVVCLRGEDRNLLTNVSKFLHSIKENEIRKTYKTKTIKYIDQKRMQLLERVGFVKSNKDKHARLNITHNVIQEELCLVGPDEQVSDALKIYTAITEKTFDLGTNVASFISSKELWKEHFIQKLKDDGINGTISFDEDNSSITLSAAKTVDCDRMERLLFDSLQMDTFPFTKERDVVVGGEKFEKFCAKLKDETHLEIQVNTSKSIIELYGAPEIVANAKNEIKTFLETENICSESRKVSSGTIKLLAGHLSGKVKKIEESLKQNNVSIVIAEEIQTVKIEGTREGLDKCGKLLTELLSTIVEREKQFSSPNLTKLFMGEDGQEQLKVIEVEKQVHISVTKCAARQENEEPKTEPKPALTKSQRGFRGPSVGYCRDGFTSTEGVKVSIKDDCIENAEKADILVNFAQSDLNNPQPVVRNFLTKRGGPKFVEACKVHTNVPVGNIVCTSGGDLKSQYVIHAVFCDWDETDKTKEIFQTLIKKILSKCNELNVRSVAMPIIGTGPHCFPEKHVFKILKEEVEKMSSSHSSQLSVQDIRVIVFSGQKESRFIQSVSSPSLQLLPLTNKPALRFGSVSINLSEGDVTQHPADVILNVIHRNVQLSSGGGVSKSILRAGGPRIQQELDTLSKQLPTGSLFSTSGGLMKNVKSVLHFVPNSTDIPGITASIEQCLRETRNRSLKRISIPAIGTASFNITPKNSAELILNAARNFSKMDYELEIDIVVFQNAMMSDFRAVVQESAKENLKAAESLPRRLSDSTKIPSSSDQVTTMMIGDSNEVVELLFVAAAPQHIDESIEKVNKFIERSVTRKELKLLNINEKVKKNLPEIQKLARDNKVLIDNSSPGVVSILGMKEDVSECVSRLRSLLADPVADIPLPDHWDTQPPDKKVHLVSLSAVSPEYQKVLKHFMSKGGTFEIISKIERIQNPEWYKAYLVKRQPLNGEENEMKLFHGTHKDNVPFINANNFSRNYAGKHGVLYGDGVYFARDASYSLKYSRQDSTGLSKMYVVNVLVGKFTKGEKGMKTPPSRNQPSNPQLLYDSVVDNVDDPSIFVIFADHQCYPEYLITFK